jgi:hypothetical protein
MYTLLTVSSVVGSRLIPEWTISLPKEKLDTLMHKVMKKEDEVLLNKLWQEIKDPQGKMSVIFLHDDEIV